MAGDDDINIRVRLREARRVGAEFKKLGKTVDDFGDRARRSGDGFGGLNEQLGATMRVITLFRPVALITGLGLIAQGAAAAAAGLTGLAAALTPLAGAMIAWPAAMIAIHQGLGTVGFATQGLMDTVGGLHEMMNADKLGQLTAPMQEFAMFLDSLKPGLIEIQERAQAGLLPGMKGAIETLLPLMAPLEQLAFLTGQRMGFLMQQSAAVAMTWRNDLATVGLNNLTLLSNLAGVGQNLGSAFVDLLTVAQPLILWMFRGLEAWSESVMHWTQGARESGRLAGMMGEVRQSMELVGGILGPLMRGVAGVFRAALPVGQELLAMLGATTQKWNEWVNSAAGQNSIRDFFEASKPAVVEMGRFIRDLTKGFMGLATDGNIAPMIAQLRTEMLPALINLVRVITGEFGPVFITALTNIVQLFSALAGDGGVIGAMVSTVGAAAGGIHTLITFNPMVAQLVAWISKGVGFLLGFNMVLGALGFVALRTLKALGTFIGFMGNVLGIVKGAGKALLWVGRLVLPVLRLAFVPLIGAVWGFTAALLANPITWIVLGVVALGAAFVLAYKRIGWFREGVNAVFGFVRKNWPTILAILTGPIGIATLIIVRNWGRIRAGASALIGHLRRGWQGFIGFFTGIPAALARAGAGMWDWILGAFRGVLNHVIRMWNDFELTVNIPDRIPGLPNEYTVNTPNVPMLAAGGTATAPGWAVVGERGPEMRYMPAGATVRPLSRSERASVASPGLGRDVLADADTTIVVPLYIDGRKVGESVARASRREAARR